jgi:hypothetical protein
VCGDDHDITHASTVLFQILFSDKGRVAGRADWLVDQQLDKLGGCLFMKIHLCKNESLEPMPSCVR